MPKSNIIKALEELDKEDLYSFILFVLRRLKNVSEYAVLSELVYILDNESFIKFLNYFEGQTITIPKIEDIKTILNSLLFYERKANTDIDDNAILKELDIPTHKKQEIINILNLIGDILKEYDFKREK